MMRCREHIISFVSIRLLICLYILQAVIFFYDMASSIDYVDYKPFVLSE